VINFDDEIKRYKPCLEIDEAEQAIYDYEVKDVTDILNEMIKEFKFNKDND